jgi:hypothetical protein
MTTTMVVATIPRLLPADRRLVGGTERPAPTSVLSDPHEVGEGLKLSRRLVDFFEARLLLGQDIRKTHGNTFDIEG